jgi:hypothetical protein
MKALAIWKTLDLDNLDRALGMTVYNSVEAPEGMKIVRDWLEFNKRFCEEFCEGIQENGRERFEKRHLKN